MREINLNDAEGHLAELVDDAVAGHEIILARGGVPLVRLTPVEISTQVRILGMDEGQIWVADDFDAPLAEFEAVLEEPATSL
ncbi:MAG: type II toxin-antitoxin system prevent-host-death family antitoxin [Acidobacteria bacterium]|nr:type II toxin-antitoxin system prevent-host-death family antitoxin [Acidobacteriota bacterium]